MASTRVIRLLPSSARMPPHLPRPSCTRFSPAYISSFPGNMMPCWKLFDTFDSCPSLRRWMTTSTSMSNAQQMEAARLLSILNNAVYNQRTLESVQAAVSSIAASNSVLQKELPLDQSTFLDALSLFESFAVALPLNDPNPTVQCSKEDKVLSTAMALFEIADKSSSRFSLEEKAYNSMLRISLARNNTYAAVGFALEAEFNFLPIYLDFDLQIQFAQRMQTELSSSTTYVVRSTLEWARATLSRVNSQEAYLLSCSSSSSSSPFFTSPFDSEDDIKGMSDEEKAIHYRKQREGAQRLVEALSILLDQAAISSASPDGLSSKR